jgi:hypothetical protein
MSYLTWNKDTVDDATIVSHLEELSDGKVKLQETVRLNHTAELLAMTAQKRAAHSGTSSGSSRGGKGRGQRRKKK